MNEDIILLNNLIEKTKNTLRQIINLKQAELELGCVDGTIIGTGRSDYTQEYSIYDISINNKIFSMIDIPGIEGDESAFEETIKNALEKAHLVFYINGSGKKIEKDSLMKIQRYMRDGTSVYAIFNTHCKAKKERVPGIDKTYSEELNQAYKTSRKVIKQTEVEFEDFLGKNYKDGIALNGLLAFCSVAFDENKKTTIKDEKDKNLRSDQIKYLREYNYDYDKMRKDSRLETLSKIIEGKISSFDVDIKNENLKKLKNRLNEMIKVVSELKKQETKKMNGYIRLMDEYELNCQDAKDDYIQTINQISTVSVSEPLDNIVEELFNKIDDEKGFLNEKKIEGFFESKSEEIKKQITENVNSALDAANKSFDDSIKDAKERLNKDIKREQIKYSASLVSLSLDNKLAKELKFNMKDFGKHALGVGSMALSGAGIGSLIAPGIGTAIGAAAGAILGAIFRLWNYLANRKTRANKVKTAIIEAVDEQKIEISDRIDEKIQEMKLEDKIIDIYNDIYYSSEKEKKELEEVKTLLNNVEKELKSINKKLA